MLTLDEIKEISFRKAGFNGYKTDEVDKFIDDVVDTVDKLLAEKTDILRKLEILVKKVEEYRSAEDAVGVAMLNAQKIADNSIKTAKEQSESMLQKAKEASDNLLKTTSEKSDNMLRDAREKSEAMLKDAKEKSDNMIREATLKARDTVIEANEKAENIIYEANAAIINNKDLLIAIESEVADFKARIMKEYKNHLKLIDSLPNKEQAQINRANINARYAVPDYVTPIDVSPYTVYDEKEQKETQQEQYIVNENEKVIEDTSNDDTKPFPQHIDIEGLAGYGELNFKNDN